MASMDQREIEPVSYDALFERVAVQQTGEMNLRIWLSCAHIKNPAERLATGIRLFVQRAHEEPHWGNMMLSLGFRAAAIRALLSSAVTQDLSAGQKQNLLNIGPDQIESATAHVCGAVVGAVSLVLNNAAPWEHAANQAAEFTLRAFGMTAEQARSLSTTPLPELAPSPSSAQSNPRPPNFT